MVLSGSPAGAVAARAAAKAAINPSIWTSTEAQHCPGAPSIQGWIRLGGSAGPDDVAAVLLVGDQLPVVGGHRLAVAPAGAGALGQPRIRHRLIPADHLVAVPVRLGHHHLFIVVPRHV